MIQIDMADWSTKDNLLTTMHR